jgi:hypothetical protein
MILLVVNFSGSSLLETAVNAEFHLWSVAQQSPHQSAITNQNQNITT